MDLNYSPEEDAFRHEVKAFLSTAVPPDLAQKVGNDLTLTKDDMVRWQQILGEKGWLTARWPVEAGGLGWNAVQGHIFDEESFNYNAPRVQPFGTNMVGPVIIRFGTEAQKDRFLPGIRSSEVWWCQGYSEPGAGSDLASLRTSAVRDGDDYVVNGQKIWTTYAHFADWMFCLVRTDPDAARQQEGISFLLIDMTSPGIEVRPIRTIDGQHHVNEVFLTNVRVPVENRIGAENQGWTCAKYLLEHERTAIARVGNNKWMLERLKAMARTEMLNGRPLIEDPLFRARLSRVEIELRALEITTMRVLSAQATGAPVGITPSVLKIRGSEIIQRLAELGKAAVGNYALPDNPEALVWNSNAEPIGPDYAAPRAPEYLGNFKFSIFGGTNEIQKNIISKIRLRA